MADIVVGIDIGTTKVCSIIGRLNKDNNIEILGKGIDPCSGVKKGIIVDIESTSDSIKNSVKKAEAMAQLKVESAYVNIAGTHVNIINKRHRVSISHENREITSRDLERLMYEAQNVPVPEDRQIIDIAARQYIIDGYDEIIDPIGMIGVKLEADFDIVAGKITSVQNIVRSMEKSGIRVDGIVAEAFATGEIALTYDEKDMGAILIDVGGGITDISIFKKNRVIFYDSIPVGGDHITNDISIGLKIPYQEAEKIKKEYELALTKLIKNDQEVSVTDANDARRKNILVSEVVEIIEARMCEIFSLCRDSIARSEIYERLGGVVLTGGGALYLDGAKQIASEIFEMPVRLANYKAHGNLTSEYAMAAGIIKYMAGRNKYSTVRSQTKTHRVDAVKKERNFLEKIAVFFNKFF